MTAWLDNRTNKCSDEAQQGMLMRAINRGKRESKCDRSGEWGRKGGRDGRGGERQVIACAEIPGSGLSVREWAVSVCTADDQLNAGADHHQLRQSCRTSLPRSMPACSATYCLHR
jgi:hypothetical protein